MAEQSDSRIQHLAIITCVLLAVILYIGWSIQQVPERLAVEFSDVELPTSMPGYNTVAANPYGTTSTASAPLPSPRGVTVNISSTAPNQHIQAIPGSSSAPVSSSAKTVSPPKSVNTNTTKTIQPQRNTSDVSAMAGGSNLQSNQVRVNSYVIKQGDTIWGISKQVLGDGNRWKELQKANPTVLANPSRLPVGAAITIP